MSREKESSLHLQRGVVILAASGLALTAACSLIPSNTELTATVTRSGTSDDIQGVDLLAGSVVDLQCYLAALRVYNVHVESVPEGYLAGTYLTGVPEQYLRINGNPNEVPPC